MPIDVDGRGPCLAIGRILRITTAHTQYAHRALLIDVISGTGDDGTTEDTTTQGLFGSPCVVLSSVLLLSTVPEIPLGHGLVGVLAIIFH